MAAAAVQQIPGGQAAAGFGTGGGGNGEDGGGGKRPGGSKRSREEEHDAEEGEVGPRKKQRGGRGTGKMTKGQCLNCKAGGHQWEFCYSKCVHCQTKNHPRLPCPEKGLKWYEHKTQYLRKDTVEKMATGPLFKERAQLREQVRDRDAQIADLQQRLNDGKEDEDAGVDVPRRTLADAIQELEWHQDWIRDTRRSIRELDDALAVESSDDEDKEEVRGFLGAAKRS